MIWYDRGRYGISAVPTLMHGRYVKGCGLAIVATLLPFICVQSHYNLLDRSPEREIMPFCGAERLGMMTYSPLAIGLLTGRFRHGVSPPA